MSRPGRPQLVAGALAVGVAVLLVGCGRDAGPDVVAEQDPGIVAALADPIMSDPGLTGQDQGSDAVTLVAARIALPPEQRAPEAVAAARAQAARLAGGRIVAAPGGRERTGDVPSKIARAPTAARVAEAAGMASAACARGLTYTAAWAAALPEALVAYPHGAVEEAAGSDAAGCRLRAVRYATPVAPGDVLDFHYTRLRAGGYGAAHSIDASDHVLRGGKPGGAVYALYVRVRGDGMTEVDLVVSGGSD